MKKAQSLFRTEKSIFIDMIVTNQYNKVRRYQYFNFEALVAIISFKTGQVRVGLRDRGFRTTKRIKYA